MKNNIWIKWLGKLLIVLSFIYIGKSIWDSRESVANSLNGTVLLVLIVNGCIVASGTILYSFLYRTLVSNISGREVKNHLVVLPYVEANLYKYLPGNIMHYVGRNKIAANGTVTFEQLNAASLVEIFISILSSACLGILFSGSYLLTFALTFIRIEWIITIIILGIVAALIVLSVFRRRFTTIIKLLFTRQVMVTVLIIFGIYSLCNILGQFIFVLLLCALGGNIPTESILSVIGASQLAWLIGFMTPGAPGGIGVREAMLQFLLSEFVPTWVVTTAGVLTRVTQIIGEMTAFFIVWLVYRRKPNLQEDNR